MKASASSSMIGMSYSNPSRGSKSNNTLAVRNSNYQNVTNGSANHFNHFKNVSRDASNEKIVASKRSSTNPHTPFNVTMSSTIKH